MIVRAAFLTRDGVRGGAAGSSALAFRAAPRLLPAVAMTSNRGIARLTLCLVLALAGRVDAAQSQDSESKPEKPTNTLLQLLPLDEIGEPSRHVLDQERPITRSTPMDDRPIYSLYFPPNPPPLGVEIALGDIDTRVGAPADLAPWVMEPFYAPLSTQVIERSLSREHRAALAAYEETRAALVAALRTRLDEVAAIGATSRRVALEEFATRQAPELSALEQNAERLREELSRSSASWYSQRGWKLGRGRLNLPRDQTLFLEYQLLRAAAFYQEGLSPPQRRLLRECAIELEARVFPGSTTSDPQAADWFWFFSPHLARIHLPDDLPGDIRDLIVRYREAKAAVKTALRDAVYGGDDVTFESTRTSTLRVLAAAQAEAIAALEEQADMIRQRLALAAPPNVPEGPRALPAELSAMIEEYRALKRTLEQELADCLRRAVRHLIVPDRYTSAPSLNDWREARMAALAEAREGFRKENAARIAELRARQDAVRAAIETWQASTGAPTTLSVGTGSFLSDFFAGRGEQQARHDYHLAVFEPGLSPEQRRLLFGAAIVAMNLPRPGPEEQPTSLPGTLLR